MANSSFFGTSGTTASVTNTIQTSVDAAAASATAAATSATASETAKTASETAKTASQTAQAASEAARDTALSHRNTANTHRADAETAKNNAQTAQAASEAARNTALTHKNDAAKLAINAEDSQFTLADGATTGFSALHHAAKAEDHKTAAASSATSAAASLASFQGQYSTGSSDPTTNLDAGDLFFNTTSNDFKVYTGSAWVTTTPSSSNQTAINTVAGIQSDVTAVAGKATEVGRLGTTDAVADMNILGTSTNVTNMATLANVSTNITTVANNVTGVNSFADRYRIGSSDPSSSNDEGDLFYNTSSNTLKVYTGSAWEQGVTAGSGFLPLSGGQLTGNLTFSGSQTVDGRDVSADGTKLDGIEANATADQTASEIKTAYESNSNTNAFTDALQTKLNGIEASATADQSDAEIKTAYESNSDTNAFTDALLSKLNGIEASATADQSASEIKTAYESNSDTNALTDALLSKLNAIEASATADQTASEIRTLVESASDSNVFTDADHTKLNGIEASADVTDTANVTSAGALMTTGGTISGNLTLTGDLNGSGHVKSEGPDGGMIMRSWTQNSTYASLATNGMSGQEYIIINNGEDTYLGSGASGSTRIRGPNNSSAAQITVGASQIDVAGPFYVPGKLGRDSTDYIQWTNNNRLDFYVNNSNEFRMEADGDFHADGNVVAYSTTVSDPRLKENIEPVTDALAKVEKLNGYTFVYKTDGVASAGVMSTDVREVLPSAIKQSKLPLKTGDDNETEYDLVQYDQLHALLIEAVKELSARVKELENDAAK